MPYVVHQHVVLDGPHEPWALAVYLHRQVLLRIVHVLLMGMCRVI